MFFSKKKNLFSFLLVIQFILTSVVLSQNYNLNITGPKRDYYYVGENITLYWNSNFIGIGNILFSLNEGVRWDTIATSVRLEYGNCQWKIPKTNFNNCIIKFASIDGSLKTTKDFSIIDDNYKINFNLYTEVVKPDSNYKLLDIEVITYNSQNLFLFNYMVNNSIVVKCVDETAETIFEKNIEILQNETYLKSTAFNWDEKFYLVNSYKKVVQHTEDSILFFSKIKIFNITSSEEIFNNDYYLGDEVSKNNLYEYYTKKIQLNTNFIKTESVGNIFKIFTGLNIDTSINYSYFGRGTREDKIVQYRFVNNFDSLKVNTVGGGKSLFSNLGNNKKYSIAEKEDYKYGPASGKYKSYNIISSDETTIDTLHSINGDFYRDAHNYDYRDFPYSFNFKSDYLYLNNKLNPVLFFEKRNGNNSDVYTYQNILCYSPYFEIIKWEVTDNVHHYEFNRKDYKYLMSIPFMNNDLNGVLYLRATENVNDHHWVFRNYEDGEIKFIIPATFVKPTTLRMNDKNDAFFFVDTDSSYQIYSLENIVEILVQDTTQNNIKTNNYSLYQNYPNPFNPETTINYQLKIPGLVSRS
ncbi:MAG: hypothetical protein GY932_09475, partial [Arcobacter sp.]|nr:hypothetical protein [Arcobacter sp.]